MHYRKGAKEMHIYFAGTQGFDAARAIAPGRGRSAESAAAWSLLLFALRRERGLVTLPAIALDASGKPYFPTVPDICFSLSHTRGYVLCALSSVPVGADVQVVSDRDARFASRLMSERERAEFRCTSCGACARRSTSSAAAAACAPCPSGARGA